MLEARPFFKLTALQANLISLFCAAMMTGVLLVIVVGYRHTTFGLLALAGMGGIGIGIAIFKWPSLGAYILVVSVFSNASSILTDQGWPGINKPLIALAFLSLLVHRLSHHQPFRPFKPIEWFMLAYGGVWLASAFVAQDQDIVIGRVVDFAKDFVLLLCIVYSLEYREKAWKVTVWLLILTAAILAALGAYQMFSGDFDQTFFGFSKFIQAQIVKSAADSARFSGPLDDPNFWGQTLMSVLPLALYRFLDERKFSLRLIAGLSTLLIVLAILNTYSRGAFLAMMIILVLIALERRVNISLILLVVVTSLVMTPFLPQGFTDRLETLFVFTDKDASVRSEDSFRGRSSEMQTGVNIFTDHPILGVGVGNYAINYQEYARYLGLEHRTEDRQAHSLYLEIAAETGLLGLITFGGLIVAFMSGLGQARRKLKSVKGCEHWATWVISLQMGLLAYLISSIFLHGDYIRYLWLPIGLTIAITYLAEDLHKKGQGSLSQGLSS